jgi:hypothetical protein
VRSLVCVLLLALTLPAHADDPKPGAGAVLGGTPREQALRLYTQATKMFGDEDWIAAAVTFGQAQAILARIDRKPDGTVLDKEAHSYRNAALSNKATSYSRGGLFVEAYNAFVELREQFGAELAPNEREEVDDAIKHMGERIGSVKLAGLPDEGDVEVRFDGRLERRDLRQPLRMSEGDHSIDVKASGYKPFVDEITVVRQQELAVSVKLEPLKTPAKVRVESNVGGQVEIDGTARGAAPVELSLPPGKHHVVVSSESYVTQASDVELKPSERAILRVGLVRARSQIGLRIVPSYLASFPLRTDTPFGSFNGGIGLQLFQDPFRIRTLRFGLNVEYHARKLNAAAVGLVATWCPDMFASTSGKLAWCPATSSFNYVFGDRDDVFASGEGLAKLATAVELRRGAGFARVTAGISAENYSRDFPVLFGTSSRVLILWSSIAELSVGVDL